MLSQIQADKDSFALSDALDFKDAKDAVISQVSRHGDLVLRDVVPSREEDDSSRRMPLVQTRKGDPSVTIIPLYPCDICINM